MESPSKFTVSGVRQTFFNRVVNTVTFKTSTAAFLGVVMDSLTNASGLALGWKSILVTAAVSGGVVLIKDVIKILTLPQDAADPLKPEIEKKG